MSDRMMYWTPSNGTGFTGSCDGTRSVMPTREASFATPHLDPTLPFRGQPPSDAHSGSRSVTWYQPGELRTPPCEFTRDDKHEPSFPETQQVVSFEEEGMNIITLPQTPGNSNLNSYNAEDNEAWKNSAMFSLVMSEADAIYRDTNGPKRRRHQLRELARMANKLSVESWKEQAKAGTSTPGSRRPHFKVLESDGVTALNQTPGSTYSIGSAFCLVTNDVDGDVTKDLIWNTVHSELGTGATFRRGQGRQWQKADCVSGRKDQETLERKKIEQKEFEDFWQLKTQAHPSGEETSSRDGGRTVNTLGAPGSLPYL